MKSTFKLFTIMLAIFAITTEGCKKGENDPLISLKSRKARATGSWKMTAGELTISSSGMSVTAVFDGANVTVLGATSPYTMEVVLEKDGTFKRTTNDDGTVIIETGTWDFNSGVGEAKKKEQIILYTLVYTEDGNTETYTGTDAPVEYLKIDELRNKKMVVKMEGSYNDGSTTDSNSGTFTFEQ